MNSSSPPVVELFNNPEAAKTIAYMERLFLAVLLRDPVSCLLLMQVQKLLRPVGFSVLNFVMFPPAVKGIKIKKPHTEPAPFLLTYSIN